MSLSSRKPSEGKIDRPDKEFNLLINGANAQRVDNLNKREKQRVTEARSKSRESKRSWGLPTIPIRSEKTSDIKNRNETTGNSSSVERKKWTSMKNSDKAFSKLQPLLHKTESDEPHPELARTIGSDSDDNDDIENFINSMNNEDVEKLRQSIMGNTKELKSIIREINIDDMKSPDVAFKRFQTEGEDLGEEIREEIGGDDENENENVDDKGFRTAYQLRGNLGASGTNSVKRIKVVKARPISATFLNPVTLGLNAQDGGFKGSSVKQITNIKNFDLANLKKMSSNPLKKPLSNRTSDVNVMTEPAYIPENYAARDSQLRKREPTSSIITSNKSQEKSNTARTERGVDGLLRRIEMLDDNKKNFLENILDQIEKGVLEKDVLLNIDFLKIKKSGNKDKKSRTLEPKPSNQSQPSAPKQSLFAISQKKTSSSDIPEKVIQQEEKKFLREKTEIEKRETRKRFSVREELPEIADWKFDEEERKKLEKSIEKGFLRESPRKFENTHDFSIDFPDPPANKFLQPIDHDKLSHRQSLSARKHEASTKDQAILMDHPYEHQILIRVISTWGSINEAGLTEIELYNDKGEKLAFNPYDFYLKNCDLESNKGVKNLINGFKYTTHPDNMWLCSLPSPPLTPELYINIKKHTISAIRIWNYNKSIIDSVKGFKEIEIIHDDKVIWSGVLNRGPGNEFDEYVTEIILQPEVKLPPIKGPPKNLLNAEKHQPTNISDFDVESYKADVMTKERPISVPSWTNDRNDNKPNFRRQSEDIIEKLEPRHVLQKSEHEKSMPVIATHKFLEEKHGKHIESPSPVEMLQEPKNQPNHSIKSVEDFRIKSAGKIKNHPKVKDPLSAKKMEKSSPSTSPFKIDRPRLDERKPSSSAKKADENASVASVEYFNITNFGRLKPAKRDSLAEVLSLKQDVQETIRNVERLLDFKSQPIKDSEFLSQFGKKKRNPSKSPGRNPSDNEPDQVILTKDISSNNKSPIPSTKPVYYEGKEVRIPELPKGRVLKFTIYSTWGDAYYVGLNGIELFDSKGNPIIIKDIKSQVKADPADINILPGYGQDPRTIDKLFDGTYLTCDDLHVWLAPFTKGKEHIIEIDFKEVRTISMIRIWNYNKSRIHSYRGVRDVLIQLDQQPIFLGEISKAPGSLKGAENSCEYIMFTTKEEILSRIEKDDWLNKIPRTDSEAYDSNVNGERPLTGTRILDQEIKELDPWQDDRPLIDDGGRPLTMAKLAQKEDVIEERKKRNSSVGRPSFLKKKLEGTFEFRKKPVKSANGITKIPQIKCKKLTINLLESWGDPFYVGLTGIELLDQDGKKIPIHVSYLHAKPRDMNTIPGYSGDYRTLDKLVNGVNKTQDDFNMWMIPFTKNQTHYITITFPEEKTISAIKFWNYNKTREHTFRGVKLITILADGILVTPPSGILVKKAPGVDYFDFGHTIGLPFLDGWKKETVKLYTEIKPKMNTNSFLSQDYDTVEFPTGFTFRIVLNETYGDIDYVGLNGIEFYNENGSPLLQTHKVDYILAAEPSSVNILKGLENDIRTVDKLVNGENNTFDDRNMWLAPFLSEQRDRSQFKTKTNEIIISFNQPIIISCINIWNYTKTPARAVREFEIFVDDEIIYKGFMRKPPTQEGFLKGKEIVTSVLFTKNPKLIEKLKPSIYCEDGEPQKSILINEKKIMNKIVKPPTASNANLERPTTSVKGKD